jgi:hypothetical protein
MVKIQRVDIPRMARFLTGIGFDEFEEVENKTDNKFINKK